MNYNNSTPKCSSGIIRSLTYNYYHIIIVLFIIFLLPACTESCEGYETLFCKDEKPAPPAGPPCERYSIGNYYCIDNVDTLNDIENISGLNVIDKNLYILNTDLRDLEFLSGISEIQGTLLIRSNGKLVTISSIASITSVQDLKISYNPLLANLNGLDNIKAVPGDLLIEFNGSLQSMGGLNAGSSSAYVEISNNDSLMDLSALNQLTRVKDLRIQMDIQNLDIFSNLTNVEYDLLIAFTQTENLNGLQNLQRVGQKLELNSNSNLLSLDGLNPDVVFGSLIISSNPKLVSLITLNNNAVRDIVFFENNVLADISGLNNITVLNGTLAVIKNPMLFSLQKFSMLQTVNILLIQQNDGLVTLGLDSLSEVTEKFWFSNNRSLCESDIIALRNSILNQTVNIDITNNADC